MSELIFGEELLVEVLETGEKVVGSRLNSGEVVVEVLSVFGRSEDAFFFGVLRGLVGLFLVLLFFLSADFMIILFDSCLKFEYF